MTEYGVYLWVDDLRPAPDGWLHARTSDEAIHILADLNVDRVSLDHDLGGDDTGYRVVCWLEQRAFNGERVPEIGVHSANSVGRARIMQAIESIRKMLDRREDP